MKEFEIIKRYIQRGESDMYDVTEVGKLVRCKDCKHSVNGGWCKLHDTGCEQTDYCSWGVRKDGGGNEL